MMKTFRDYINLIENLQREGVAEGSEKTHGWKIGKMYRGEKEPFEVAYVDASDEKTALAKAHHTLKPNHMQILTVMRRPQGVAEEQVEESSPDAIAKINELTRR